MVDQEAVQEGFFEGNVTKASDQTADGGCEEQMSVGVISIWLCELPVGAAGPLQANGSEQVLTDRQGVFLFSGVFIMTGIVLLYQQAKEPLQEARMYLSLEQFDPHAAADSGSLTGISGTINTANETLTAPLTGTESVAYLAKEQVQQRGYKHDKETRQHRKNSPQFDDDDATKRATTWETEDVKLESVPFYLDTAHGLVAVDPAQATLKMPEKGSDMPSLPRRVVSNLVSVVTLGRIGGVDRRTKEKHFAPGDSVLVIGELEAADGSEEVVATVDSAGAHDLFTVTPRSGWSLALRSSLVAAGWSIPGLVALLFGLSFLIGSIVTGAV